MGGSNAAESDQNSATEFLEQEFGSRVEFDQPIKQRRNEVSLIPV